MEAKARKGLIIGVIVVVAVIIVGWQVAKKLRPIEYEIKDAKITKLDIAARSAAIEFVHPKTGLVTAVETTSIPDDCPVEINGRPAQLSDLRVGDVCNVRGMVHADRTVVPLWVHVTRPSGTASQPATTQAAEPG